MGPTNSIRLFDVSSTAGQRHPRAGPDAPGPTGKTTSGPERARTPRAATGRDRAVGGQVEGRRDPPGADPTAARTATDARATQTRLPAGRGSAFEVRTPV